MPAMPDGGAAEGDQGQPLQDSGVEQAPQATAADGHDQALLLVKAKGGGGHA